jgi:lipopolysaccharide transport system ATP-binding protein
MSDYCISIEHITKKYRIGELDSSSDGLRHRLERKVRGLFSSPKTLFSDNQALGTAEFLALEDVSLQVKPGEVLGIIGRNGAGKSTLLKILSRIVPPTSGQIQVEGRIASLLEVGTGFHPDLTGRENLFLNGSILGMRRAEIKRKYDEIIAFAEIEKFIDTPVKRYSSGMYVRLAFAVAAHLEPEILIIDEVLAVGDSVFQVKCLEKMESISRSGRTVLLVSHSMAPIRRLCRRAIVMQKGRIIVDSDPASAIANYMGVDNTSIGRLNLHKRLFTCDGVEIVDGWLENHGNRADTFRFDDTPTMILVINIHQACRFSVELILRQADTFPVGFAPSGMAQNWEIDGKCGRICVRAQFAPLRLANGNYSLDLILADTGVRCLDHLESGICFRVEGNVPGHRKWDFSQSTGQGCILLDVKYQAAPLPSLETASDLVPGAP